MNKPVQEAKSDRKTESGEVDSEALQHFEEEIGEAELKQLEGFAYNLARKWSLSRGVNALPKGGTFEDLVGEAVGKTLRVGKDCYAWDRSQRPDLFEHLKYVIRDILRGRWRREESELDAGHLDQSEIDRRAEEHCGEAEIQADLDHERRVEKIERLREVLREKGDDVALEVLDGKMEGFSRSEIVEIVEEIDKRDYDNAYKRIRRLGPKLLEPPPSP